MIVGRAWTGGTQRVRRTRVPRLAVTPVFVGFRRGLRSLQDCYVGKQPARRCCLPQSRRRRVYRFSIRRCNSSLSHFRERIDEPARLVFSPPLCSAASGNESAGLCTTTQQAHRTGDSFHRHSTGTSLSDYFRGAFAETPTGIPRSDADKICSSFSTRKMREFPQENELRTSPDDVYWSAAEIEKQPKFCKAA